MEFGIDKDITMKRILFILLCFSLSVNADDPVKMLDYNFVNKLRDANEDDLKTSVLSCQGVEVKPITIKSWSKSSNHMREAIFDENQMKDWALIKSIYGANVNFILRINNSSIYIPTGLNLYDRKSDSADQIHNRNLFNFKGYSANSSIQFFSSSIPGLRYGHQFSGWLDRYTGDLRITTDWPRSTSEKSYLVEAKCKRLERLL